MSKFKVGDRVQFITHTDEFYKPVWAIGTIVQIIGGGYYRIVHRDTVHDKKLVLPVYIDKEPGWDE